MEVCLGVRNGFPEFFDICNKLHLPFYIISGGIESDTSS